MIPSNIWFRQVSIQWYLTEKSFEVLPGPKISGSENEFHDQWLPELNNFLFSAEFKC